MDGSYLTQDLQLTRKPSSKGWSRSNFVFQMSCIRALAIMVSGAERPRIWYKEQIKDRIPHFDSGRFKSLILNPNSSVSTYHNTTKALSEGISFGSRFSSGVDLLSESTVDRTLLQSDVNLVRWKQPRLSILVRLDAAVLADFSSLKDGRAPST